MRSRPKRRWLWAAKARVSELELERVGNSISKSRSTPVSEAHPDNDTELEIGLKRYRRIGPWSNIGDPIYI
jgi:hypothetical protein